MSNLLDLGFILVFAPEIFVFLASSCCDTIWFFYYIFGINVLFLRPPSILYVCKPAILCGGAHLRFSLSFLDNPSPYEQLYGLFLPAAIS